MSEAATKQEIRLAIGREACMFNNPRGNGWMGKVLSESAERVVLLNPRRVTFGLHPGASDLVGWRSVLVTPEMVGTRLAAFCSLEIKKPGGKHPVTPEQQAWIDAVARAGGFAGVARNCGQARLLLGLRGE